VYTAVADKRPQLMEEAFRSIRYGK
jgi:hypothetical protein